MFGIADAMQQAADTVVSGLDDAALFAAAIEFEQARSRLEIAEARVLAELDSWAAPDTTFGLSTPAWLADRANIPPGVAAERVRRANEICRRLPVIADAVARGALTFEHARALATAANDRVVDALADVTDDIITLAGQVPFNRWHRHVRRLVHLLDRDGPTPDVDPATNRLRFRSSLDGVTHLDGTMTPDLALGIRSAIDAKADQLYKRYAADHKHHPELAIPTRATLRMLALAELVRGTTTGRAEVTLVLHDGVVSDTDDQPVPPAAAGVWGCDPDLWAVIVDRMGLPLDLGHAERFATTAQRRAITVRDGGCAFPGCHQPPKRCDVHHLISPLTGGLTDVDRMCMLCRHHHTVTHRPGWTVTPHGDGTFTWTSPTGHHLTNRAPPDHQAS